MLDVKECREQAMKCAKQAAAATDPVLKQRLSETAQGWHRLAADLAKLEEKMANQSPYGGR
jgi:hypothetical protein